MKNKLTAIKRPVMEYHLAIEPSCSFQYFLINEPVCRPESDDTKKQQPFKNKYQKSQGKRYSSNKTHEQHIENGAPFIFKIYVELRRKIIRIML